MFLNRLLILPNVSLIFAISKLFFYIRKTVHLLFCATSVLLCDEMEHLQRLKYIPLILRRIRLSLLHEEVSVVHRIKLSMTNNYDSSLLIIYNLQMVQN